MPLVQTGSLAGQHPLLSRVLANRGISTQSELDLSLAGLLPPNTLKHSDVAARRLAEAVTRNQRIL
ncbi:MAG: single-stranded-DNA-specific exonuclease RecJ, partial [Pseudomonadota bacterium]